MDGLRQVHRELSHQLDSLSFAPPVTHVYNPLSYAEVTFDQYLRRFMAGPPGRTLLLGMNPGPWGMAQTGVPFGEIAAARDWLQIQGPVEQPAILHPKRPIQGLDCPRSEVSGRRLWGLFQGMFSTAEEFAKRFVVINYCPLVFMEDSGRNRTPDRLPKHERESLFELCDNALEKLLSLLQVGRAFGVGRFATLRLKTLVKNSQRPLPVETILHPSPASPKANKDWAGQVLPILEQK